MIFAAIAAKAQVISLKDTASKHFSFSSLRTDTSKKVYNLPVSSIPANFYSTNLGFFCKKELKLEAVTKIPIKFRLGSLQYNDWMEGKPNTGALRPN